MSIFEIAALVMEWFQVGVGMFLLLVVAAIYTAVVATVACVKLHRISKKRTS
jgi:hypothetical protein